MPQDDDDDEDEEEEEEEEEEDKRTDNKDTFCLCHKPSYGEMIACDNQKCKARPPASCAAVRRPHRPHCGVVTAD
jgi:hypothetical protein